MYSCSIVNIDPCRLKGSRRSSVLLNVGNDALDPKGEDGGTNASQTSTDAAGGVGGVRDALIPIGVGPTPRGNEE
jgi:hypothetical protein